jgi:site-specific recombinase XerC
MVADHAAMRLRPHEVDVAAAICARHVPARGADHRRGGRAHQRLLAEGPTGIPNRALVWLPYRSGLRVSEAPAPRPADADLTRHALRVLPGKGDKAATRSFHLCATGALAR